jgi:hypothetical protein
MCDVCTLPGHTDCHEAVIQCHQEGPEWGWHVDAVRGMLFRLPTSELTYLYILRASTFRNLLQLLWTSSLRIG